MEFDEDSFPTQSGIDSGYRAVTPKQVAINTAVALSVLALALLLIKVQSILIVLVLAITLAAAIQPVVQRLRQIGLTRGQAVIAIYGSLLAGLGVAGYFFIPVMVGQISDLINGIPAILTDLRQQASSSDSEFLRTSGVRAINRADTAYREFRANPGVEGSTVYGYATSIGGILFSGFSVLVVTFYWTTEQAIIKRLILGLFPLDKRDRAHHVWDRIEQKLGGWARGQLILSGTIGLISTIAYYLLGLDFWIALGIIATITEIIPIIGPIIGGGAAVLVALTDSPQKALLVLVFVFVLQQLEGAILVPRVMKNAVGLTPLSVILAVLVGGTLLGPIGSIMAIPVAAALQVLVQDLLEARDDDPDVEPMLDGVDGEYPAGERQFSPEKISPQILSAASPQSDRDSSNR